eukprot:s890_g26.t1
MTQVLRPTPLRGAPEDARLQRAPRRAKSDLKWPRLLWPLLMYAVKRNADRLSLTRHRLKFLKFGDPVGSHQGQVARVSTLGFNASIASAIGQGRPHRAVQIFEKLHGFRGQPDAVTYSLLIKACNRDCWWKVLEYLAQLQKVKHDIIPYSGPHSTPSLLEKMRNLSIAPTLATFKAAASASKDRPDMVLPILETLELMLTELTELTELTHFALDETSLNMLLSSLDRCHRWQDALFHLNAAEQGGLVPDLASYNSVISACARVARWKAALGLFAEIPKGPKALKADEITLGSLVSAYYRGHWSLALQLLYEGRMQNIQPNRIMVHSAIVACEGQHWPWSLLLLEESISWRVAPDSWRS